MGLRRDVFRKGKFELLALTQTKLKGDGEVSNCSVNGITAGVQEVIELEWFSSKMLWLNSSFQVLK